MKYAFQRLADGAQIELAYAMSEAPAYGAIIDHPTHGPCRRLLSAAVVKPPSTPKGAFKGRQFPPGYAAKIGWDPRKIDRHGQPIFKDQRDAHEFARRTDGEYLYGAMPAKCEGDFRTSPKELARKRGLL